MKKILIFIFIFLCCVPFIYAQDVQLSGRNRCQFKTTQPQPPMSAPQPGYAKWEAEMKKKPHKKLKLIESHIIGKFITQENFKEDPRAINGILKFIGAKPQFGVQQFTLDYKDPSLARLSKDRLAMAAFDDTVARIAADTPDIQTITQVYHPNPAKEGQIDDEAVVIDIVIDRGMNTVYDYLALFINGHEELVLSEREREVLKDYILAGGFLFVSSCCGYRSFEEGFRQEMEKMFPHNKLEVLPPNHPLYKSYYTIDKFVYTGKEKVPAGKPYLEGINIECRTAVIFSPHDFCCAWDGHIHGDQEPYASERELGMDTALELGANMISYALGYRDLSKPLKPRKEFTKSEQSFKRGDFVFAQIKHEGDWDPDPKGIENLLEFLNQETNVKVYPKRRIVDLKKTDLFQYPFVYMTGHYGFSFDDAVISKLTTYFKKGGFLFVDACCGEQKFDTAFRECLKKIFPHTPLQEIPPHHPLCSIYYEIQKVPYTALAIKTMRRTQPAGKPQPLFSDKNSAAELIPLWQTNKDSETQPIQLEGIFLDNRLVVVYSKYDIACSWEQTPCLMCRGIDPKSQMGLKIGANIIIYSFSGE